MKIYFVSPNSAGQEDSELYRKMIQHLQKYGAVFKNSDEDRDERLRDSKAIVAEITSGNEEVGYDLGRVVERNNHATGIKRVLCLSRSPIDRGLATRISGCKNVRVVFYSTIEEAILAIDHFFENGR